LNWLQLEDGDILCFQKSFPTENGEQFSYPDVPSFLEYVHNRQVCILGLFFYAVHDFALSKGMD